MISEAKAFWDPISGKVKDQIAKEMGNALQVQRYDVTTDPDGDVMGVTQPFGSNEIFLPYSKEVAGATVGDTVLVAWWGSMSNARVYYFAKGYDGAESGSSSVIASITFPAAWTDSGNGYYTSAPTIDGVTLSAESKIDLQITAAQFITLQADGVENLYVENDNAALTAYAVGGYPSAAITLQCTITGTQAPTPPVNPSLNMIYPIGSVYTNVGNVNPGNLIGGTWERLELITMYSEWELAGTSTSSSQLVTYPADATELYIEFTSNYDSASVGGGGIYLVDKIQTLKVILVSGYYYASSDFGIVNVNHDATNRTISLRNLRYISTTSGTISVYSRKKISNGLYVWKRTA